MNWTEQAVDDLRRLWAGCHESAVWNAIARAERASEMVEMAA